MPTPEYERRHKLATQLLQAIKEQQKELDALLLECFGHWTYEDYIYRFYHQSFKVYGLQGRTTKIVEALQGLLPEVELNSWFQKILDEGTGKKFEDGHNQRWAEETRPLLEAFFHARYFLEMACKYGRELDEPPQMLPSGWAGLLYLYNIR